MMNLNGQDVVPPLNNLLPFHANTYDPTRHIVVTRDGRLVTLTWRLDDRSKQPIRGYVDGEDFSRTWYLDGVWSCQRGENQFDLFITGKHRMAEFKKCGCKKGQSCPMCSPGDPKLLPWDLRAWEEHPNQFQVRTKAGEVVTELKHSSESLFGYINGVRFIWFARTGNWRSSCQTDTDLRLVLLEPQEAPVESPETPMETPYDAPWDTKVLQWAQDRNLLAGGTVDGQFKKLVEEFGELAAALARGDMEEAKDAIGDIDVVLTILSAMLGMTRDECREKAYDAIKDRKGRMCGGVFIKEEDDK